MSGEQYLKEVADMDDLIEQKRAESVDGGLTSQVGMKVMFKGCLRELFGEGGAVLPRRLEDRDGGDQQRQRHGQGQERRERDQREYGRSGDHDAGWRG
jgi:hypothetical protein